jgi:hypothetical protein
MACKNNEVKAVPFKWERGRGTRTSLNNNPNKAKFICFERPNDNLLDLYKGQAVYWKDELEKNNQNCVYSKTSDGRRQCEDNQDIYTECQKWNKQ